MFGSWAVTRGPSLDPADKRLAVEVEDHPLEYGDFEGTIAQGQYGGGTVQLWDRGYWRPLPGTSPQAALKAGQLKFELEGQRLHGGWVLVRMRNDRGSGKRRNWLLIKQRDDAADPARSEGLLAEDRSVASGRSMAQIAAGRGKGPKPFMRASQTAKPDAKPLLAAASGPRSRCVVPNPSLASPRLDRSTRVRTHTIYIRQPTAVASSVYPSVRSSIFRQCVERTFRCASCSVDSAPLDRSGP